jgi:hypothetical protein
MNREEYYKHIEENDTYPEHSHKWIVRTYTGDKSFYRNFGTFETKEEAKEFIENYKVKYTTKGFITRYSIQGVCEVLCLRTPDELAQGHTQVPPDAL